MSACKSCGYPVKWTKEGKRWFCRNPDGSDHWDLCSKVRWLQVKETGERFEEKLVSGYRNSIHGTKYDRISAGVPKRKKVSGDCKNCVPPWEVCPICPDGVAICS